MRHALMVAILSLSVAGFTLEAQPATQQFEKQVTQASSGYLGVYLRDVTAEEVANLGLEKETGVIVERVGENSPASEGGVQDGDVILIYAGIPVISASQFQRLVAETPPDRKVSISLWRAGKKLDIEVKVGSRQSSTWRLRPEQSFSFRLPDLPDHYGPSGRDIIIAPGKPRLGVSVAALTDQMAEFLGIPGNSGVLVLEVHPGTPAERAALKAGDVIVSADGKKVSNSQELGRTLSGDAVRLEVLRRGQSLSLTVQLEPKESSSGDSIRL